MSTLKAEFSKAAKSCDRTGAQLLRDFMRDVVRQQQEKAEHDAWFRRQVQVGIDSADRGSLFHTRTQKPNPLNGVLAYSGGFKDGHRESSLDAGGFFRPLKRPASLRSDRPAECRGISGRISVD